MVPLAYMTYTAYFSGSEREMGSCIDDRHLERAREREKNRKAESEVCEASFA